MHDIYYDKQNHFYIDGVDSYPTSVRDEDCVIPLLHITEDNGLSRYHSVQTDDTQILICEKKWAHP